MSTLSGIIASPKLLDKFQHLNDQTLVVTVSEDQKYLEEDQSYVQPSSSDLASVFAGLNDHFSRIHPQPGYAIFPQPESSEFVFISFIPDLAPIRQKMLYASTKNTLIQQIGSGCFGNKHILALTELEELTPDHFYHATRSGTDPSLLTADERVLQNINLLQTLSVSQGPQSAFKKELPSMHGRTGTSLLFEVEPSLDQVLRQDLHKRLVVINIDANEHLVLTSEVKDVSVDALIDSTHLAIGDSDTTPLYIMYGYAPSKIAFIYLCPSGSKVRDRMVYAANKKGLIAHLQTEYFSANQLDKVLEVGDLGELDLSILEAVPDTESTAPKTGLKFTKPKGPRRR